MILAIFLYYLWVVIDVCLAYALLYCSYKEDDSEEGVSERIKFPLWTHLLAVFVSVIPFVNFIGAIALVSIMYILSHDEDVTFRTFLFKKI